MKNWLGCFFVFIGFSLSAHAQTQYAFRIGFTDKKGSPSLSNPLGFLSQRALDRRIAQGISPDATDQPVSPLYLDTVLNLSQGTLHVSSKWLNQCVILVTDTSKIALLRTRPYVSFTELVGFFPGGLHLVQSTGQPENDILFPGFKTTGAPAFYGASWQQTSVMNGDCLHDKGFLGQGQLIAVLDDGFHFIDTAPAFDSLYQSGRIKDTRDFVYAHSDVYSDFRIHGTVVLSTMAAYLPGTYVGAAPLADYALYATEIPNAEQPVELDQMIAAFERADSIGADVISSSLGYNSFDVPFPSIPPSALDGKTTPAAKAANMAAQKGILMVITAGNEGSGGLLTPGDADSALTVGSVTTSLTPAGNSGHGPNAALHIKPEVCAQGSPGMVMGSGMAPYPVSGTSIATPQIAGFAACLLQASPGATNSAVKAGILKSSSFFNNPQLPQLGYGIPDFCEADIILDVKDVPGVKENLNVFPNPVEDRLIVEGLFLKAQSLRLTISDVTGKEVYSAEHRVHSGKNMLIFSLNHSVSKGIYFYRILSNEKIMKSGKLIRN